MKYINILSLVQAYISLKKQNYSDYLNHYGLEIKNYETEDLKSLTKALYDITKDHSIFNKFYIGYKIPQIGKEFDLLRFGKEYVINIELKSKCTDEKIKKQLIRNYYYLSYLEKPIYNICFVSETNQVFLLNRSRNIEIYKFSELEQLLRNQETENIKNVDDLFNPSDYLVSPFNSTQKFLKNKYFLTHQQEKFKSNILKALNNKSISNFISVTGSAGTGKTLLIYDIVKEIISNGKKILIIHCGYLNAGQEILNIEGWEIIPIKNLNYYNLSDYDAVFLDEVQRIYPKQLSSIVETIKSINGNCILSYDKVQTLAQSEENNQIASKINAINSIVKYRLSEKIRTNKEIASFIKSLFNNKRNFKFTNKDNIELNYFKNIDDAKNYLESIKNCEWEVLRFTPSQYKSEHHEKYFDFNFKNSHKVIGQEFDNVVVVIDKFFSYNTEGVLIYKSGAYYHPVKMLFQNMTRTRKKINLVIIDNEELLNRCIFILKKKIL